MEDIFYHIYVWVRRNKLLAATIALLFLAGCGLLASKLRFEEDITQIIPKNERTDELSKVLKQINFADKITVLIERNEATKPSVLTAIAGAFIDSMETDIAYIRGITGRIEQEEMESTYNLVYQHLPLFLDERDYRTIAERLQPDSIAERVSENYRTLISPTGLVMRNFIQRDPLGLALLGLKKMQQHTVGENFMLYDGFIATKDTSQLLLFLDPTFQGADTEHNTALVEHLERLRDTLHQQFEQKAAISYYGTAFIAVANAKQIKMDISTTVLISMSVLMLLLILFYRKIYVPLLVFIPTVFAALFGMACLYLYKPVISAISLSVAAVLIGITIDYALHILTHYKKSGDIRALYRELTRPLLMSGATNAVVFLCLLFVHSEALVDLGIFASICIFSSAVFTLLIVPHLYRPKQELRHNSILDKLAAFPFERSKILIAICLVLIVLSCFTGGRVGYNNNLADLNFVPKALQQMEHKLDKLTNTSSKSVYLVSTGKTFEDAAQKTDRLMSNLNTAKTKKEILDYNGLIIPLSATLQHEKINKWNQFWENQHTDNLIARLQKEGEQYGFEVETHADFYRLLKEQPKALGWHDFQLQRALGLSDFVAERNGFFTISTLVKLDDAKREPFLRAMEKNADVLVVDRQNMNETFLGQLRDDFNRLVSYSFFAVLFILWVFFRRLELVLLSAIPIGLTGLVTAGLMGLFGLEFNIFSAIVCTLVFGHGVDFSIFMTAALQKQYSTGKDTLQTYRTSILLAVLTTVLAIGALVFAKHPALLSIASVSLIGVFAAVIITFVFYPILFHFFISNRAKQGKSPFTITILLLSLLFFAYYGIGCLVVSFFGRVIVSILPLSKEKKDAFFRKTMSAFMKSVLYLHPQTKHKTINLRRETFDKPAVIIANHSSFLDTLSLGMLVPKGIFLVNDWVWNSPVFGRAVRALGFYPVSQGLENGVDVLREKVVQGYSLIVFPEGTRSYENVVKRFHKGAFYLAEQLQLDILPIYLLGNGDVLPKGDVLIFGGAMTPVIGDRIRIDDTSFGEGYLERTKRVMRHFRKRYSAWRQNEEGVFYFRKKLELAYYYKDEDIVRDVKKNIARFALHYHELDSYLGEGAHVAHLSDTHGEFDYLLSLQSGNRKLLGIIADQERRAVAESIYWIKQRQVRFAPHTAEGYTVLVIHPLIEIASLPVSLLETFEEIYTFRKAQSLRALGWEEDTLSDSLFCYT
ncbi:1-acyl-sn-glycerol-3-phosphate acyltransferase [Sphingobacterium chuzhouense]|uniref:1-acyl-sn-glycerol-3-phosphate acyltransferase n=1 Tax=Sphingobacterium chuzhouense TaxID=1742264 RepID=A0ABR7XNS8_9SPHI|nr:1-acyl-sn-glycerol-3-phosphate acyltransferase [Sphingobacterium chuzhouense]MBD1420826.1 1-acyl-sn-glycerol-3-phosphate acyltransferase [Sphingobacterium chuzhouense]